MKNKELLTSLINLQFSIANHDISYGYLVLHQKQIEENSGEPWYQHYTITTEQSLFFKELMIPILIKELKLSKYRAEKEYGWFILAYGLKIKDNDGT